MKEYDLIMQAKETLVRAADLITEKEVTLVARPQ